jgi:hypothetical protein
VARTGTVSCLLSRLCSHGGVRLLEQDMPNWSNYKVKQGQVIMVMGTPSGKEIKTPEVGTQARAPRAPRRRSSAVPAPAIRYLCVTVPPPRRPRARVL